MYSELLETLREEIKHQLTEIEANGDWFGHIQRQDIRNGKLKNIVLRL